MGWDCPPSRPAPRDILIFEVALHDMQFLVAWIPTQPRAINIEISNQKTLQTLNSYLHLSPKHKQQRDDT